jgi:hypothetical protein
MTIRILSRCDNVATKLDGRFIQEYDPTRGGVDPDGRPWVHLVTTCDPAEARQFPCAREAVNYYWQTTGCLRPDGKGDRPLTAYHVEIS